ncbi:MAG: imidazolonepropionase [Oscillospiraceae bacterium]|nr:imidazolonepropionase [Oscillospiraceae bacterium]
MAGFVIENIGMLATPMGTAAKYGEGQGEVSIMRDAWISVSDGFIEGVGSGAVPKAENTFDAGGGLVTPGLVDPHTHLVFGGWREHELAMKLRDVPYLDILAAGGGILSTVRSTRAASEAELIDKAMLVLERMLALGVTTCEAKSGYGLSLDDELKLLRAAVKLDEMQPIDIVRTFMGAHAVPPEYIDDRDAYVDLVVDKMIPAAAGMAEYCDVFCETGAFTVEETRRILLSAKDAGLRPKCHSDEINAIGGTEMAAEIGAVSCEHLICVEPAGIEAMSRHGTIACCLPATSFYLNAAYAPARAMISAGIPVAFGSDFNPGSCPTYSLQLAMNIGCYKYRMTPEECLTAVTLNAAAAIGRAAIVGSVEVGKKADILIWDAPNLEQICYRFGDNLVRSVFKNGELRSGATSHVK